MCKNGWKNYKVWLYWNWENKFLQHKIPISISNIDINEKIVSNKVSFNKKSY